MAMMSSIEGVAVREASLNNDCQNMEDKTTRTRPKKQEQSATKDLNTCT